MQLAVQDSNQYILSANCMVSKKETSTNSVNTNILTFKEKVDDSYQNISTVLSLKLCM